METRGTQERARTGDVTDVGKREEAAPHSRMDPAEEPWQVALGSEMDSRGRNPGYGQHIHVEMGGEWVGTKVEMTFHNGHQIQTVLPQGG